MMCIRAANNGAVSSQSSATAQWSTNVFRVHRIAGARKAFGERAANAGGAVISICWGAPPVVSPNRRASHPALVR
jgi:hypothetical protein